MPVTTIGCSELDLVTPAEVLKLLSSLPSSKASSVDVIPVHVLKSCATFFAPLLAQLANLSFTEGVFPASFKHAQVTPLLKSPGLDPSVPSSFRPISNLRTIGKIIERLIHSRLLSHLSQSASFPTLQSGYCANFSTETALVKLTNDLFANAGLGSPSAVLSLDMSAAFDCISHQKLVDRFRDVFNVSGLALNWLKSYLCDRTFCVKVGGEKSSVSNISSGVPQGSVLGPLLFIVYIAPIEHLVNSFSCVQQISYADDLTLYMNLKSGTVSNFKLCVNAVRDWLLFNDLLLNPDKSQCMKVGTRQKLGAFSDPSLDVCGTLVPYSESLKLLGATFDSTLSFDKHISSVCSSCFYHIRALRHIRKHITPATASLIATTFIASKLDYCNAILGGLTKHNLNRLQHVQNATARAVLNRQARTDPPVLCKSLHWLPIKWRIDYKIAVLTYKTVLTGAPSYLFDLLNVSKPSRTLRSSRNGLLFEVPFVKTDFESRAFSVYAPRLWNTLPKNLRDMLSVDPNHQSSSLDTFKCSLKTLFFQYAFAGVV